MKILRTYIGIDPGLLRTGWAIIRSDGANIFNYVDSGVFKPGCDSSYALSYRLHLIFDFLMKLMEKHDAYSAGIENTYVNSNYGSSLKLSHARAAAMIACAANNIEVDEYQAKTVKKIITGQGNASKEQLYNALKFYIKAENEVMTADILKKLSKSQDESDALAIGICHALFQNNPLIKRDKIEL